MSLMPKSVVGGIEKQLNRANGLACVHDGYFPFFFY